MEFDYFTCITDSLKNITNSLAATNQLPLSPVQIQPSPPYYRQPSQDDGRKVSDYFAILIITTAKALYERQILIYPRCRAIYIRKGKKIVSVSNGKPVIPMIRALR